MLFNVIVKINVGSCIYGQKNICTLNVKYISKRVVAVTLYTPYSVVICKICTYTGSAKFMATHILTWFSYKNEEN